VSSKEPRDGFGFVYILSHPSMPNVFKVGITTNSVRQRIQELNTTGVPKPFKAEKIFEIHVRHLRAVEQLAHAKLKQKDLHHGKEFFEGQMKDCVEAVEDSIFELTNSHTEDLVGKAAKRAAEEQRQRDFELIRIESERKQREIKQDRVRKANIEIDAQRAQYIMALARQRKDKEPFLDRYIWGPLGFIFLGFVGIAIMISTGPLGWIGVPLLVYWIYQKDQRDTEKSLNTAAERVYPYKTMADFD
jgi:hypothetical protein